MNKLILNKSIVFTIGFVLLIVFLIINIPCKAQQKLYAQNISININNEFNKEILNDKFYSNRNNGKIISELKLTSRERELLREIKQLSNEAKQWLKEAKQVNKEIQELNKIIKISKPFNDIHSKAVRKEARYKEFEIALRYDAEEFLEMSSSLLFNIYENHIPTYEQIISSNFNNYQQIIDLNNEAQTLFKKAKKNQEKAYNDFNYKLGLEYLKKANNLELEALRKQERAFALYFDIPITNNKYEFTENTKSKELSPTLKEKTEKELENIFDNKSDEIKEFTADKIILNTENKIVEKVVFKVQVGAFINNVDENEFHGLNPLSADTKDQNSYTKYMVGEYYSYKAACESKKIIINTTNYKDAFIVAYVNGKRMPVDVVLCEHIR